MEIPKFIPETNKNVVEPIKHVIPTNSTDLEKDPSNDRKNFFHNPSDDDSKGPDVENKGKIIDELA